MTQKELAYVEDAIGHEKNIVDILNDTISRLKDEKLKNFIGEEVAKHKQMKCSLMNLLEVKKND